MTKKILFLLCLLAPSITQAQLLNVAITQSIYQYDDIARYYFNQPMIKQLSNKIEITTISDLNSENLSADILITDYLNPQTHCAAEPKNNDPIVDLMLTQEKQLSTLANKVDCGLPLALDAFVVVYNRNMTFTQAPSQSTDLFDLEHFKGKRLLPRNLSAVLEWSMLSYDVPAQEYYDILSTDRGIDLAFERLNQIGQEHIIWWDTIDQALSALSSGDVAMAVINYSALAQADEATRHNHVVVWDHLIFNPIVALINPIDSDSLSAKALKPWYNHPWQQQLMNDYGLFPVDEQDLLGAIKDDQFPAKSIENAIIIDHVWQLSLAKRLQKRLAQWKQP